MLRSCLLAALAVAPSVVFAQQPAPTARPAVAPSATAPTARPATAPSTTAPAAAAPNAAQQAQLTKQNTEMTQAALRVAQMVDGTQVGPLWDGASSVAKKAVTREQFVGQIGSQRTQLGPVVGRGQGAVTRVKYGPGAQVPEGLYINVSFPTRFAKAPQPVRELVSFRLDEDKTWRLAGYSLRASAK
ncbi:DUF4019 domain-containing protein [Xanthomonas campestris]|uniref:DUF4019 domain-containing protein n=1 Tax=Xanthomonas campestris TaxID=339 RepID=UPI00096EA5C8|nr:DUF4019 domain-containing protein [Xanthomonas campestris]MCF8825893.1 DUF4019 domain-containing protein [Xanthomonas campestris pv. raphani]MEA9838599.1 DUF4019 domain-containing protein [Xanthomonas campestris pv. raphani]MEA9875259.1 DUF4019 domain-containing protein [Xanthomonas campestris pv. raphani]MEA9891332.1 DUF4019 domain-containing protein [Xanthomonas campestris pv. raphani]MEA9934016.1 DUF4019 domain-containing protein [Xanthomonas campestris pv. raphani]